MIYLELAQVLSLHAGLILQSDGAVGVRDPGALQSAVAQPRMAALAYSLVLNHPFVDGNKRVGQMAMEAMLLYNGFEIHAPVGEQESVFLSLAAGQLTSERLIEWITRHVVPRGKAPKDS